MSVENPLIAGFLPIQNRSSFLCQWLNVGSIFRQIFEYANQRPCEDNPPKNPITLDPDTDQYYVLTPQPI